VLDVVRRGPRRGRPRRKSVGRGGSSCLVRCGFLRPLRPNQFHGVFGTSGICGKDARFSLIIVPEEKNVVDKWHKVWAKVSDFGILPTCK
jgi:hypothetical protein